MLTFKSARDVRPERDFRLAHESGMCGADQRVGRSPETVAWLAKVLAEMDGQKREWPMFEPRMLKRFLQAVGFDIKAAAEEDADALPVPEDLHTPETCFEKLRGASFLTMPAGAACFRLNERQARSLVRG